jgi:hypothetical protein
MEAKCYLCVFASGSGGGLVDEHAEVRKAAFGRDDRPPFAATFFPPNPMNPTCIMAGEPRVFLILGRRNIPEIADPVIAAIAIDVINLANRPRSREQQPNNPVGTVRSVEYFTALVAAHVSQEGLCIGVSAIPAITRVGGGLDAIFEHILSTRKPEQLSGFKICPQNAPNIVVRKFGHSSIPFQRGFCNVGHFFTDMGAFGRAESLDIAEGGSASDERIADANVVFVLLSVPVFEELSFPFETHAFFENFRRDPPSDLDADTHSLASVIVGSEGEGAAGRGIQCVGSTSGSLS